MPSLQQKVVMILIVLYIFIVSTQFYIIFSITGMATAQGTVGLTVLRPFVFGISLDSDNKSTILNWSYVPTAQHYNIYYSSNISAIEMLNLSSIPQDVSNFSNITTLNYTDTTADQVQRRYYTLSYFDGSQEILSTDRTAGKFTYYYTVPSSGIYGPLTSNRIILYLDYNYTAETFLQPISAALNPTISRLDKSNASGEFLTTHVRGLLDGNDFQMNATYSYQITVNGEFNQTTTGKVYNPPYILDYDNFNSTIYGPLASNWRGVYDFKKNYTAESLLQEIPAALNPTISRLDKSNASGEFLTTHVRGLNDGNNFSVLVGTGYVITVDNNYNHTLCSSKTNCFG